MSKIKNGGLDQYGAESLEQQQFGTLSTPAVPNCSCSKSPVPYWSNPPFLIFDILALSPERQSARMSKIKNGGLDQYGKV